MRNVHYRKRRKKKKFRKYSCPLCSNGIRTLCPLYSGCGRTLGLLCARNRVAALVNSFVLCFC